MLAASETSWNQTWHVPTAAQPPTGEEFIRLAATRLGVEARYRVLTPFMLKVAGVFNSDVRELGEMLYQYASPYVLDSSKIHQGFRFRADRLRGRHQANDVNLPGAAVIGIRRESDLEDRHVRIA